MSDGTDSPASLAWNTFATAFRRKSRTFVTGHIRAIAVVALVLSSILAKTLIFGTGFRNSSSSDTSASILYEVDSVRDGVLLDFDKRSGWTRIHDRRLPDADVFVSNTETLLSIAGVPQLVRLPNDFILVDTGMVSPDVLALGLDRGPRECTFASSRERLLLSFFFAKSGVKFPSDVGIRGRTTLVDVTGYCPIHASDGDADGPAPPSSDTVVAYSSLYGDERLTVDQTLQEFEHLWAVAADG